ncbi:MAG: SDR family NAD(P)-dependent oxidoreductase, partial [Pontibacterium sp.]
IPRPAAFLDPETIKIIGPRLSSHNSMPSGHTLSAFVVAGLMLRVCVNLKQRILVLVAAGFVAWSRVAVGAHWPVDTLMGATGGLVCAWAGLKIADRFAKGYSWKGYIAIVILLMGCAIALPYHDGGYTGVEYFAFTVSACAIFYWLAGMYEEELLPSIRLKEAPRIFPYSNKFDPSFKAEVLVTGAAGFIGFHVCKRLIADGYKVVGIDGINDYYSPKLKRDRIAILRESDDFRFIRMDVAEPGRIEKLFNTYSFDKVIHLAAQAGARHSLKKPFDYAHSNVTGMLTILEGCKKHKIKHLLYASSSSLYGNNTKIPFSVKDPVDHPASLYAATKKSNELMAHSYSHLYGIPTTGLRFFTVYGPWGRPDMAPMLFTKAIMEGKPIKVFNHGKLSRDFTYIDDIVEGIVRLLDKVPAPNPNWNGERDSSDAPYRIYNIGNHQPIQLEDFISAIEKAVGKKAIKEYLPMQLGDVHTTYADTDTLREDVGFDPATPIDEGIQKFVDWYKDYYAQADKK